MVNIMVIMMIWKEKRRSSSTTSCSNSKNGYQDGFIITIIVAFDIVSDVHISYFYDRSASKPKDQ